MQIIPISPVASQIINIVLNNQATQLFIYQLSTGLYVDVSLNNTLVIGGVLCHNRNLIVQNLYLGFSGDFIFVDITNTYTPYIVPGSIANNILIEGNDPSYTGLGSQFVLYYLTPQNLSVLVPNYA